MPKLVKLIFSFGLSLGAGFLGSLATAPAIDSWYTNLNKPFFNPPNWLFAPIWTVLYLLMGAAFFLIWVSRKKIKKSVYFYLAQLGLNTLWSFLFFGLKMPSVALLEIVILWVFIYLTAANFYRINKLATYFLLPYLAWVSFAVFLNYSLVLLN